MSLDPTRVRYDALVRVVEEYRQQGLTPSTEWFNEIKTLAAANPGWFSPPSSPQTQVSSATPLPPPRAATPLMPGERILVRVDDDIERVVKEVLEKWAARVCVFQAAGKLFEIQEEKQSNKMKFLVRSATAPKLLQVGSARARALAARECKFGIEKMTKDGTYDISPCLPPEWLGPSITTRPVFDDIPVLSALACAPTLRYDGELIWERGYDASTGIFLASDLQVKLPENPTQEDAKLATAKLLDLISDFDFCNVGGPSVWLAGLLSIAARHTFAGPAPICIIDASKRGSGKTILVDVATLIAIGTQSPRMYFTEDDAEMDKRITALALSGEQVVLIDNVAGKFASPPLDAALTSESYTGRVLGKSEMTGAIPMKIVWWATGNGIIIGADMARRALLARLEPATDRPEDRTGPRPGTNWKYPRLIEHVTQNRVDLLSAALTIVRAYIRAGRPNMGLSPMGSFEAWSDTIRSAIVWAGATDPCATVQEAREADLQDQALRTMVECWPEAGENTITTAELIRHAENGKPSMADKYGEPEKKLREVSASEMWRNALLDWLPARGSAELPTARDLGYALRAIKGSIVGNYKIEAGKHGMSGTPWVRICLNPTSVAKNTTKSDVQLSVVGSSLTDSRASS